MTQRLILPGQFLGKENGRVHPRPLLPQEMLPQGGLRLPIPAVSCPSSAPCLVWLLFLIPFPLWFPSQLVRPLRTWCLKHPLRFEASLPFFLYCHQEKKKKKERSPSLVLSWRGLSTCAPTHGAITDGRSTAALAPGTPPHLSSGIPWAGLSLEAGSCLSKKILAVFHSCLRSLRLVTCVSPPTPPSVLWFTGLD